MGQLTFSIARLDDIPALAALVQAAYRGDASRVGWTTEADLLDGQRVDETMLRETIDRDDTSILLARDEGTLVACCELQRPASDGLAHLGMFAVDPVLQGGGHGRAVLSEAERFAHDRWGATAIEIEVIDARQALVEWYERRGFVATGELRPFPYGDERFGEPRRDDLRFAVMRKALTS